MPSQPGYEELKQKVRALEQENARLNADKDNYKQLLENLSEVVYSVNSDACITYISPNVERITGYTPAELIGRAFTDFVHPEDLAKRIENFQHALAGEEFSSEYRFITKNNACLWGYTRHKPVYEEGAVVGVQGVMVDITGRKQAEEALETMAEMLDNAPNSITVHDMNGRFLFANRRTFELHGYQPEEFLSINLCDLDVPESAALLEERFRRIREEGEARFEVAHYRRDGSTFPLEVHAKTIDWYGQPAVLSIADDITERKQTQAELERLMSAIEQTREVIVITDTDGTIQFVNPAFEQVTGYTREEALGQNPRILKSGEQDNAFYQQLWVTLTSGRTWHGRFINRKKDGSLYTEEAAISPVTDASGRIINYLAVKRDVTEEIKVEEQLYQAQKMESIGRLAGGVAHDLNNLLSPILGYGEMLLEDTPPNNPRREPLEEVVSAGKRAQSLVRQLLAFSRRQSLQFQPIDVNDLLGDFKKLLRRTVREDIEIHMRLPPRIPQVKGDLGQLEQVVMNLAVNSQDAMPNGGRLTIETEQVELDEDYARKKRGVKPGPYVKVAISDTGFGMDADTLEHLFEPFFTTKESGKGTGLGMSTAYGIVKQHGGNIWAYSECGLGTTIKVYLPIPAETLEKVSDSAPKQPEIRGSETILLVEDDRQVRNLASIVLERCGYTVLSAASGEEALSVLQSHTGEMHLLLTDVIMPDMNGKEVFEQISESWPDVRVLYMSGYTDDVIAHHGVIDAGVNFIEKPFNIKTLATKVQEVLNQ